MRSASQYGQLRAWFLRVVFVWPGLAAISLSTVFGANPNSRFNVRVWQSDEGLPNNTIYALAQTPDGYLWVGTHEGLARFDGVRFLIVDEAVAPDLRHGKITALCAARDGSLWVACEGSGVYQMNRGKVTHYGEPEGLPSNLTRSLLQTSDGAIWIGSDGGVTRFKDGRFKTFTEKNGLGANLVKDLCEDRDGILRIATQRGLSSLNKEELISTVNFDLGTARNALKSVCQDRHGSIWVTSNEGLTCASDKEKKSYGVAEGLPHRVATDVMEDRSGRVWVGTYYGIACMEEGKVVAKPMNDSGFGDLVYTIFEDREENLWVGARDGLYRLRPARFTSYTMQDGLGSDNVMSVCEDRTGALWIGTWGGGVSVLKDEKFTVFGTSNGPTHEAVLSLREAHDGTMWVGMDFDGGINRLTRDGHNVFARPGGLINAAILTIYEASDRTLWVGTRRGLNVIKKGKAASYNVSRGLAGNNVNVIHEDPEHSIWLGTEGGISRWTDGKFQNFTTNEGLSHNWVNAIYQDKERTLWFGTKSGLNRFKNGKFTVYTTSQGMFSDEIYEIVEDDLDCFWMSCRTGLFRVSKKELEDFAAGKAKFVTSTVFGKADGLASVQCNGLAKPAGWKGHDGRLWFPTIRGVVAVESQIKANSQPPLVLIEEVMADRKKIAVSPGEVVTDELPLVAMVRRPFQIPPGRGDLEIQYTALGLRAPEKNRFKYMLEPIDTGWVEAGVRRSAYYNNLGPGDYRFRVVASNNDGIWNETGAALSFVFLPHYWQTWWFKVSIPVGFLLVLWAWYRFRVAQLRQIERLRIQIASDLHDDVGSRLTKVAMVTEFVDRETMDSDRSKSHIQAIARTTREVIQSMDEIVWTINPKNDTLDNLANYIFQYTQEYFQNTNVRCRIDVPAKLPEHELSTEDRHNVFMAVKEALNNVLKHSRADEVRIGLTVENSKMTIRIVDNGKGFEVSKVNGAGNGLENMRSRLNRVGGRLMIESNPGSGTRVEMEAPVN